MPIFFLQQRIGVVKELEDVLLRMTRVPFPFFTGEDRRGAVHFKIQEVAVGKSLKEVERWCVILKCSRSKIMGYFKSRGSKVLFLTQVFQKSQCTRKTPYEYCIKVNRYALLKGTQ